MSIMKFTRHNIDRIEAGAKTQTRRPIKPQPPKDWSGYVLITQYKVGDVVQLATPDCSHVDTKIRITGLRIERVQDIDTADAIAEGCEFIDDTAETRHWRNYASGNAVGWYQGPFAHRHSFASLWGTIYGPEHEFAWSQNPWCWVYEFGVSQ